MDATLGWCTVIAELELSFKKSWTSTFQRISGNNLWDDFIEYSSNICSLALASLLTFCSCNFFLLPVSFWMIVISLCHLQSFITLAFLFLEITRLQEDSAGFDLSYFIHNAPQLWGVDGDGSDLLPRVRGPAVGDRASGHALLRVWRQMPRKVPGPAQRRLFTKWENYMTWIHNFFHIFEFEIRKCLSLGKNLEDTTQSQGAFTSFSTAAHKTFDFKATRECCYRDVSNRFCISPDTLCCEWHGAFTVHPVTATYYSFCLDFSIRDAAVVTAWANKNNVTRRLQDDPHSNPHAPELD